MGSPGFETGHHNFDPSAAVAAWPHRWSVRGPVAPVGMKTRLSGRTSGETISLPGPYVCVQWGMTAPPPRKDEHAN